MAKRHCFHVPDFPCRKLSGRFPREQLRSEHVLARSILDNDPDPWDQREELVFAWCLPFCNCLSLAKTRPASGEKRAEIVLVRCNSICFKRVVSLWPCEPWVVSVQQHVSVFNLAWTRLPGALGFWLNISQFDGCIAVKHVAQRGSTKNGTATQHIERQDIALT